jgi:hypothetical protein
MYTIPNGSFSNRKINLKKKISIINILNSEERKENHRSRNVEFIVCVFYVNRVSYDEVKMKQDKTKNVKIGNSRDRFTLIAIRL